MTVLIWPQDDSAARLLILQDDFLSFHASTSQEKINTEENVCVASEFLLRRVAKCSRKLCCCSFLHVFSGCLLFCCQVSNHQQLQTYCNTAAVSRGKLLTRLSDSTKEGDPSSVRYSSKWESPCHMLLSGLNRTTFFDDVKNVLVPWRH